MWRTFGLFSLLDDDEKLHCGHLRSEVCVDVCFHSLGFIRRSGVAGSEGNSVCFSTSCRPSPAGLSAAPLGFPSSSVWASRFSTALPTLVTAWLLDRSHPGGCALRAHGHLNLRFPDVRWFLFLWRAVYTDPEPLFSDGSFGFCYWVVRVFMYCGYQSFIRYLIGKYFLPFSGLSLLSNIWGKQVSELN